MPGMLVSIMCGVNARLLGYMLKSQAGGQLGIGRFDQDRSIAKDDGRNHALAVVDAFDVSHGLRVPLDVHPLVFDLLFALELLGESAVGTPIGAVNRDVRLVDDTLLDSYDVVLNKRPPLLLQHG